VRGEVVARDGGPPRPPEALRGEVLEAFVVLRTDDAGDDGLAAELQAAAAS